MGNFFTSLGSAFIVFFKYAASVALLVVIGALVFAIVQGNYGRLEILMFWLGWCFAMYLLGRGLNIDIVVLFSESIHRGFRAVTMFLLAILFLYKFLEILAYYLDYPIEEEIIVYFIPYFIPDVTYSHYIGYDSTKDYRAPTASYYEAGFLINIDLHSTLDGLAVLDTTSGLEWIHLRKTKGLPYDKVVDELSEGGSFYGWRLPTDSEMSNLLFKAFPESTSSFRRKGMGKNEKRNGNWTDLFGNLYVDYGWTTAGWYKKENGVVDIVGLSKNNYVYAAITKDNRYDSYRKTGFKELGTWLVSDGGATLTSQLYPEVNIPSKDNLRN